MAIPLPHFEHHRDKTNFIVPSLIRSWCAETKKQACSHVGLCAAASVLVRGEREARVGGRPVRAGPGQTVGGAHRRGGGVGASHGAAALKQRGNRYVYMDNAAAGK